MDDWDWCLHLHMRDAYVSSDLVQLLIGDLASSDDGAIHIIGIEIQWPGGQACAPGWQLDYSQWLVLKRVKPNNRDHTRHFGVWSGYPGGSQVCVSNGG